MYDIIHDDICTSAMALVRSVFKQNVNVSIVPQVQKQEGAVDCGLFSIAIATSLLDVSNHWNGIRTGLE